ncbi:unnamed protein product [Caenorhabditis bovis]|uniref:MAM domain-containing protein n=1 Tax=Caenorhabditis bovis TaxID=2654633 RepID=A0A8S1EQ06_9PELO|nr:unnamed protein product [Caenorhabditis bovis]
MRILLIILLICYTARAILAKSSLDCDFSGDCCWATTREDEQWEVRHADELDINEFRKTFLTGKSRPPPNGNYAIRVENKRKSSLISCAVCSRNGTVQVKFRHWQSANAILKICWQNEGDGSPAAENCQDARHSRQSKLNTYSFRNIERNRNFRLVFIVENADAEKSGNEATILIDRITVDFAPCEHQHRASHSIQRVTEHKKQKRMKRPKQVSKNGTVTLEKLAKLDEKLKEKIKNEEKEKAYLKNVDQQIAKVVEELDAKTKPVDPLTDLLGKEFVDFLDPNYEYDDDEETEKAETPKKTTPAPVKTTKPPVKRVETAKKEVHPETGAPKNLQPATNHLPIRPIAPPSEILKFIPRGKPMPVQPQNGAFSLPSQPHHLIPLGIPSTCDTAGGCLFEKDFCGWQTPATIQNKFYIKKVVPSSFAEAIVPVGEVAVMETTTKMTQAHTILFDSLEFTTGTRLIACCLAGDQFVCPFSTPSEQSAVIWQFSKFECPIGTSKIAFICENYGLTNGICGVDNIRIHTSTDVFFLEPCQKEKLH